ncbi:MAG: TVP38/TMEM64 family protein [Oligoflexia bacterium]|nr:TVP38/TMEM64 family protein [Oligoflexia bacterium]
MIQENIKLISVVKILTVFFIVLLFILFFYFDLNRYFSMDFFLNEKKRLFALYENSPVLFIFAYFCVYVFCATINIPGAALLTLIAGFIFDFLVGSLVVSLGSTVGATFSFLISRFLIKDFIQKKLARYLKTINDGFKKDGFFYLLSLRLIPVFPFFLVNLLMGVSSISSRQFIAGSFLGMLPSTFVYVNAGRQLAHIESIYQIFSIEIILSFALLALLPWIIKGGLKISRNFQFFKVKERILKFSREFQFLRMKRVLKAVKKILTLLIPNF